LGYRIYSDLVEFFFDKQEMRTWFKGYSRFEELTDDPAAVKKFEKIRERYYYGSSQHFYHALITDALDKQDFAISLPSGDEQPSAAGGNDPSSKGKSKELKTVIPTKDDIVFSSGEKADKFYLYWKGRLMVRYKKNPYGKNRIQSLGFRDGMLGTGIESGIDLLTSPVILSGNGTLQNPLSVQYSGYWSYERNASMLPMDYQPGKKVE
jgi:hypothetical protein